MITSDLSFLTEISFNDISIRTEIFNEVKAVGLLSSPSYLISGERMLHVETVRVGGLIITEVGGGGAVRPTLYRGYLDLRSGLEIRPLDWSVQ